MGPWLVKVVSEEMPDGLDLGASQCKLALTDDEVWEASLSGFEDVASQARQERVDCPRESGAHGDVQY